MGYESQCTWRLDGDTGVGKAVLESHVLIVRGPSRLIIPLASVTSAAADGGRLTLAFDGRTAELALGPDAAKWARRITSPPSRLSKLGIRAGQRVLVAGPVDDGFVSELEAAGTIVVRRSTSAPVDIAFLALDRPAALARIASVARSLAPAGALWTLRTKGQPVVTEADTMAAGKRAGLVDVKVVSFSDTLTAEKFVIPVARRAASGSRAVP